MISDARGRHVSPGVYTEEKDVTYSVKSLGITSLGLVGETLKGPAFQNIEIEDWSTFVDYFGGTSTEKFKKNGRPRYELPYIAKEYLQKSQRLNVVRVLGLSGYNAGPAWVLYQGEHPILILRSKMSYSGISNKLSYCEQKPESAEALVTTITKQEYKGTGYDTVCAEVDLKEDDLASKYDVNAKYKLGIKVTCTTEGGGSTKEYVYNVSLNSKDRDFIYNVLGASPVSGEAPVYIESLFEGMIDSTKELGNDFVKEEATKTRSYYTIVQDGTKMVDGKSEDTYKLEPTTASPSDAKVYTGTVVHVGDKDKDGKLIDGLTEKELGTFKEGDIVMLENVDKKDYYTSFYSPFRYARTPWVVSNVSANGSTHTATMKKLFRVITIADGNSANYQVKISIQNINPNDGTFDVVVRDFYDSDSSPLILEKFSKCNMAEGDSRFIGYKIGTVDGSYANKSKYITVEIADSENLESCVPAGFLGYPSLFGKKINLAYNNKFDVGVKAKRQYFGLNKDVLDEDILNYQGYYAYTDSDTNPDKLTNGFHLDSILNMKDYSNGIKVDGDSGFTFTTVSTESVSANDTKIPRIIGGSYMNDTIYSDINARKFTLYPYGGFDGWDINRGYRTNADDYKASRYKVTESSVFHSINDKNENFSGYLDTLKLGSEAITSDYYAFLAGYRQFANPQDIDINVFATPGIDWKNNTLLTEDALDIIEDKEDGRGGDALYIMDSPQYDDDGNMMAVEEIVDELEGTQIDSSYACTYFPWIKYFDSSLNKYIDLPVTKDVVRNIADTDNNAYPWFAPAGISRGNVNCIMAVKKTTLDDEDDLYENRINPVKSFAQDGVKIWGNKTLYSSETSPLNRINVRRLMIRIKKLVVDAAQALIFEQYDTTLEKQFRSLVEPILADAKSNRGIADYKLDTEVTAETMDQHILPAVIKVKPTPAMEYISISFVVYPQSVSFDEN